MPSRRQRFRPISRTVRWWCLFVTLTGAVVVRAQVPGDLTADIPGQPLADALTAYAQQTGLQLVYVSDIARGKSSKSVPAGLSHHAALARLLEGTGLQFEFLNERSVRILAAANAITSPHTATIGPEEVVVTATKRVESLATVPMSVNVFSCNDARAQGIRGIQDIAARIAGMEYDFSSQFGFGTVTNVALRGINSRTGQSTTALYIDDAPFMLGMSVLAWYRREGGFVDRVNPFTLATVDANANSNSTALFRVAFAFAPVDAVRVLPSYTYQSHDIHDSPNFYLYLSSPDAGVPRNGKLLRQPLPLNHPSYT